MRFESENAREIPRSYGILGLVWFWYPMLQTQNAPLVYTGMGYMYIPPRCPGGNQPPRGILFAVRYVYRTHGGYSFEDSVASAIPLWFLLLPTKGSLSVCFLCPSHSVYSTSEFPQAQMQRDLCFVTRRPFPPGGKFTSRFYPQQPGFS